ncbi:MAG TPA: amidohydrolase family protein [Candidatus Dormibacteraeota bacterium]
MYTQSLAIVADRLVDGTGADPVTGAVVVVEDGRIRAAGARSQVSIPAEAQVVEGDDLTVLPGLMDMHVHLGCLSGIDFAKLLMTQRSLLLLHAVPHCAATLRAGVTTVRDAGLTPASVRTAVERGLFPGPRLEMAVSILSQTGGHADERMPCGSSLAMDCGMDVPHSRVDGEDAMRAKVREVLRAGADWIKICTSGGVLSAGDLPDHAQFTLGEIGVAVEEAARRGKRVMAHAMSAEGIKNALRAGVVSIEHGCLVDEEGIALMKQHGAFLVPTLVAPGDVIAGAESGQTIPEEMLDKARRVMERHRASVREAITQGVRIAMGTDAAVGPHGGNLRELALMVECGMTPMQAIEASTRTTAQLLRRDHELGTLRAGMLADVVAVRGNPLDDITLLSDRERIALVVKDGHIAHNALAEAPVAAATLR